MTDQNKELAAYVTEQLSGLGEVIPQKAGVGRARECIKEKRVKVARKNAGDFLLLLKCSDSIIPVTKNNHFYSSGGRRYGQESGGFIE